MPPQPPPSQAGRFKPRKKPAKKIRVGEAATAAGPTAGGGGGSAAATTAGGGEAAAAACGSPSGRGGRGGRAPAGGGSGRGGGWLGGRGGGRLGGRAPPQPVAQGQAFFQATPQPSGPSSSRRSNAASSGGGGGASSSVGALNRTAASRAASRGGASAHAAPGIGEGQEEIVGILEEGVGAAAAASASQLEDKKRGARSGSSALDREEGAGSGTTSSGRKGRAGPAATSSEFSIYYDDDSSEDGDAAPASRRSARPQPHPSSGRLQPMALPEPHVPAARPDKLASDGASALARSDDDDVEGTDNPLLALTSKLRRATMGSTDAAQQEPKQEWLLVQLPTRLPPLAQLAVPPETVSGGGGGGGEGAGPVAGANATSPTQLVWPAPPGGGAAMISGNDPVSVPSVRADRFDHDALRNARPGRLGRLVVCRSGAMHLILEGPDDGAPAIRMDVTGRECGLVQQAVSIDANSQKLVMLGNVQHSLVVTPDLSVD